MRIAAFLACLVFASGAFATPFTWDIANSDVTAGGFGPGGGSSGGNFPYFFSLPIGGGTNGASCSGTITFNASGVLFQVGAMYTQWYQSGGSSQAFVQGKLTFTPTVPNLSYSFTGFMNVIESGISPRNSTCAVELHPNYPHPPSLYTNNQYYTGAAGLWNPGDFQLGAATGNLVQGLEYVMTWDFRINMTGAEDQTARYEVKMKNGPNFFFHLYQRPCPGDLNGDGYVDDSDFVLFANAYDVLDCADPLMPPGCPSDMNNDGLVDDADFVLFAQAYENLVCP